MSDDLEPYQEALWELKDERSWGEVAEVLPVEASEPLVSGAANDNLDHVSEEKRNSIALALLDHARECKRRAQSGLHHAMQAIQRAKADTLTDEEADEIMDGLKNFADKMT